jgi:hypothetical protein
MTGGSSKNRKNFSKPSNGSNNREQTMKTSESINKISTALLDAQQAITFAAKDSRNPHFKNTYADLPSVIDAIKGPLNKAGIVFLQTGSPSDDGCLHLTTRLQHSSGEWIEDTLVMPLPKQDPQGFGSAMTYARRYALSAITGLYQDDDDGNKGSGIYNNAPQPERKPKAQPKAEVQKTMTAEQFDEVVDILGNATNVDSKKLIKEEWKRFDGDQRQYLKEAFPAIFEKEAA